MVVREHLYKIADELTPGASLEDVIEKLLLLYKIEKGLSQADEGKIVPHNEVEQRAEEWLK